MVDSEAKKSSSLIGNQESFFNSGAAQGYSSSDSSDFSDDSFGDDSDEIDAAAAEADAFNKSKLP